MLKEILKEQDLFSLKFYNKKTIDEKQKEEILKTLCLSLHHEVSQIVSSSNFKIFDKTNVLLEKDKILYNSVDAFRYILAILNLYDISSEEFMSAYKEKDIYLNHKNNKKIKSENKPVIVFDIDDVIANFRTSFNTWMNKKYNLNISDENTSYYSSKEVEKVGLNPNNVFNQFIAEDGFMSLDTFKNVRKVMKDIKEMGILIYLLTSRPEDNLKVKYQTYKWLIDQEIPFDELYFTPEKYIWLTTQEFYLKKKLLFTVDDSPKHALEYATHGVNVFVPETAYNKNAIHANIKKYKNIEEIMFNIT